jgi:thiol-disulfide isomerase/thioredoxin
MAQSLYKKTDGVVILSDANFTGSKVTSGFKGAGVLKAYAVWCPHCQDKVQDFKTLAKCFKDEKIGLCVYVIEADQNSKFASACEIESFPTMLYVDGNGSTAALTNAQGMPVHAVPDILTALCSTKKKCVKKFKA